MAEKAQRKTSSREYTMECIHDRSATLPKSNTAKYETYSQRFVSDSELAGMLRVRRRTLNDYRFAEILLSDKALYKESDIQKMLGKAHRPAFDNRNLV